MKKNIFRPGSFLEHQGNPKIKQVGKPLQDNDFLMKFISEDSLFGEHIPDARKAFNPCSAR